MDAVGDRADRPLRDGQIRPERLKHFARDLAVQLADGVDRAGRAHRERRHVELSAVAVAIVVIPEREECIAVFAHRSPATGEMLLDEREGKRVVSGRHRGVRRENRRPAYFFDRRFPSVVRGQQVADALQHHKGGVAFVQVPDRRRHAERA